MDKKALTTYDVAQFCHVTINTVVNWIEDGSLKAFRTKGGHRRIRSSDFDEFLSKHNMPIADGKRILVVDDDESIRNGLRELFESNGYQVDTAKEGFMAGALIEQYRPALIILDLIMPGLDGFFVCEHVKKQEHLKDIKIIVLTGYPSRENIQEVKRAGANKVIPKPVDNEIILKEVQNLLGAKHAIT